MSKSRSKIRYQTENHLKDLGKLSDTIFPEISKSNLAIYYAGGSLWDKLELIRLNIEHTHTILMHMVTMLKPGSETFLDAKTRNEWAGLLDLRVRSFITFEKIINKMNMALRADKNRLVTLRTIQENLKKTPVNYRAIYKKAKSTMMREKLTLR